MTLPIVTTADADSYFATTPRLVAWEAVADPDTQIAEASTWLSALCWDEKATCCGNDFTAAYTRAVSELALALSNNPTALIGTGAGSTSATGAIKRQKLDVLEVEYFEPSSGSASTTSRYGPRAPLVLQKFGWLGDIIGCWILNTGNSNLMLRVRS